MKKLKESKLKYYPDAEEWKQIKREAKYRYGTLQNYSMEVFGWKYPQFFRKCSPKYVNYFTLLEYMTLKKTLGIEFKLH